MRTQKELGRKDWVIPQITYTQLDLEQCPESVINSVYDVSYNEMTTDEKTQVLNGYQTSFTAKIKNLITEWNSYRYLSDHKGYSSRFVL